MRSTIATRGALAFSLMWGLGCHYQPTPVPLRGTPSDIAALAGTWEGEYIGRESGRSGTIQFTIRAGTDTAYGDVLMEAPNQQRFVAADAETGMHATHARAPHLLLVRWVEISQGSLEGKLERYRAPDCDCIVETTFWGQLSDRVILGNYLTRGENGLRQGGTWSVRRTKTIAMR